MLQTLGEGREKERLFTVFVTFFVMIGMNKLKNWHR